MLNTTTYSVTVTENKCTDTDEVIVFVQPNPVANAGDNQTICANTSALLMASGGDTYLWNSGVNTNSFTTPVLVSQTTYTVTVSEKKCSDTDEVVVFIAIPPLADAGEDKSICANQLAHLFATGGDTYLWSTSQTNADISPSPLENTTYTVTVTKNGCTNTDDVSVVVYALPTIHLGEDMLVCSRDSVHIQSYSTSGNLTYDWLDRDDTTAGIGEVALKNASYTLLVTDEHSCTAQDVVNVVVVPLPLSPKIDDVAICKSVSNNAVLRIKSPSKELGYQWYTLQDSVPIVNDTTFLSLSSVLRDTSFVLYATNSFGCKSDPVYPKITIGFEPLADFFMEPNPAYIGDEITFTNTSYRQDSIVMNFWKFGVEENQLMDIHPKHTYEQAGYYDVELVVVSAANCLSMIKKTIRIKPKLDIFIPSAFTPNTDYINDVFYARGEVIDDMHMRIYNQWGLLIFQTKNKFIGWDGTWKGESQPEGNYTYVFECTTFDQQLIHLTGVFSLIR